ncbi:MAG: hypothetical protein PHS79_00275 [Patescibacteria group bacterium]|nr:hypothetical protein [Patescibacteria group bacterium]
MIHRQPNDGLHVIIEGIDGSGKSTVLNACRAWAEERGISFFDAVEFSTREGRLPTVDEVESVTGLMTAEPTFCWTGRAIREEMIAKHVDVVRGTWDVIRYSGWETAHGFSVDRLVQFRRVIIPFLQNHSDRIIFQDRSLASTLAYQPLQDESLTTEKLLSLPGNAQTIAFAPTLLILIRTEAAAAMARLSGRTEKQDEHIFEVEDFQQRLVKRFLSDDVLGPFKQAGTLIAEVDGNQSIEAVGESVKALLSQNLPNFARI